MLEPRLFAPCVYTYIYICIHMNGSKKRADRCALPERWVQHIHIYVYIVVRFWSENISSYLICPSVLDIILGGFSRFHSSDSRDGLRFEEKRADAAAVVVPHRWLIFALEYFIR